jgi:hypothetical protein
MQIIYLDILLFFVVDKIPYPGMHPHIVIDFVNIRFCGRPYKSNKTLTILPCLSSDGVK